MVEFVLLLLIIAIGLAEPQVIDASTLPKKKREIPKTIVGETVFGDFVEGAREGNLSAE